MKIFLLLIWTLLFLLIGQRSAISDDNVLMTDQFYDSKEDYSLFAGRVSDKDQSQVILKISTENKNIRFFRAGDPVDFRVEKKKGDSCRGFVRGVEPGFMVLFVRDLGACWKEDFFRRGTQLTFHSETLSDRVKEASEYRKQLLERKKDFLIQMKNINHFLWTWSQQKMQIAAVYDKKIVEIQNHKQISMSQHLEKKKEQIIVQKELTSQLVKLEEDLKFYRIDRQEIFDDRWHLDQELGLPFANRPPQEKEKEYKTSF